MAYVYSLKLNCLIFIKKNANNVLIQTFSQLVFSPILFKFYPSTFFHLISINEQPFQFNDLFLNYFSYIYFQVHWMKFKKEYRWLLFLLVPFIAFVIIHFMVPLQFVLNAQPRVTQSYNLQTTEKDQLSVRSSAIGLSQICSDTLSNYNRLFYLFVPSQNSQQYSAINVNKVIINNAFTFSKAHKQDTNFVQPVSMWSASTAQTFSQLNPDQALRYNEYLLVQPYIRSTFSKPSSNSLIGAMAYYPCSQNSNILFDYPSAFQQNLANFNTSTEQLIFEQALKNYQATNSTMLSFNYPEKSSLTSNLFHLCTLIFSSTNLSSVSGIFCLKIDLFSFAQSVYLSFQNLGSYHQSTDYLSLLTPKNQEGNSFILTNITMQGATITYNFPQNQTLTFINFKYDGVFQSQAFLSKPKYPNYYNFRINDKNYFIVSVELQHPQLSTYSTGLYILTHNHFLITGANLQFSSIYTNTLNTLLIPTLILIIISVIVSIFVLRFLLNSLDKQLFNLNERCKFIVDGDLNIEIPEFKGAKDIADVYDQVRIINKLHRFTSKEYFVGHFSNKILKYNEALQLIKQLKYDKSFLLQNIGEAYLYIEQYQKSLSFLKESVSMLQTKMQHQFYGLDKMLQLKQQRTKIPMMYRQMEIIMIRRLWKLIFTYFKYVELQVINIKQLDDQISTEKEKMQKKQKLKRQTGEYITKIKKVFYPDYKSYAECVMLLGFQTKFHLTNKNYDAARQTCSKCVKITQLYVKEYDDNTKKLKEKGSKNLFFFKRNKLTGHSRANPNIMEAFCNYSKALLLINDPKSKNLYEAAELLVDGLKFGVMSQSVNFLLINQLRKLCAGLKVNLQKFETTQIFHQSMPYKTLHYGPITKQNQALLYRIPKNAAEVEARQYVIFLDNSQYYCGQAKFSCQLKYMQDRSNYLFDKQIKKFDRISLLQSNSQTSLETHCSLTLKQANEAILKKTWLDMFKYSHFGGSTQLIESLFQIAYRTKKLQCQKVIIVFLKYIQSYSDERLLQRLPVLKSKHKKRIDEKMKEMKELKEKERIVMMDDIGLSLIELMNIEGMRNCKLIFICAEGQDADTVMHYFGIKDINKRIWSKTDHINKNNNLIYVIDQRHKSDFDRILMSKLANVPDNHVFTL